MLPTARCPAGDGDAGVYRLAQCFVHTSGALLLELQDGDLYDRHLRSLRAPNARPEVPAAHAAAGPGPSNAPALGAAGEGAAGADVDGGGGQDYNYDMDLGVDADSDGEFGGGFDGDFDPNMAADADASNAHGPSSAGDYTAADGPSGTAARQAGERDRPARGRGRGAAPQGSDEYYDPYQPLDPNDRNPALVKPLQVGLTWVYGDLYGRLCVGGWSSLAHWNLGLNICQGGRVGGVGGWGVYLRHLVSVLV